MISALLGRVPELDEVDDHQPETHGTLTRCSLDGQLYPCSTIESARALARLDVAVLEMIDVGWTVWQRVPDQLDPRPVGGIVVGYTDSEETGRIFRILTTKHGRPTTREIAARDIDPHQIALPNSRSLVQSYRDLCRHVGKQTGSADGTDTRWIATALALSQSAS